MDNPHIETNEIIADSEDEGYGHAHWNRASASKSAEPFHSADVQQLASVDLPDGQIDYFAGCRDDVFLPIPSIAERAKTRKRKSKVKQSQAFQDVIELTDDDEFMPDQPPSKSKKIKEKAVQDLPETDQSTSSAPAPQNFQPTNDPVTINARNKVRPRPSKKTHSPQPGPISEITLQNSTSSFSTPLDRLVNNYSHSGLPPDLPLTKPLTQDRDIHPPPIEFLPPPQEDTDTPLLSSRSEENVDELQYRSKQLYADPGDNTSPPPTFFVGSSSLALPVLTTPLLPLSQSGDMVDPTSMVIEPLIDVPNANINTRTKKSRKPRKKQGEVGNVDFDAPQTNICEREKARTDEVIVEIPLPSPTVDRDQSPVLNSRKCRRKQILDDHTEDELNIGAGQPEPIVDVPVHHPSPLLGSNKEQPQGDPDTLDLTEIPKLQKQKDRKCKSGQDIDDNAPFAPVTRRRKKTLHSTEAGEQEQTFEALTTPFKMSKRGKKGSGESGKDDNIQVSGIKGKRRMTISSDDESDGNVGLIAEEAQAPSTDFEEYLKANENSPLLDDSAKAADHQDGRNVLRDIQVQNSSPGSGAVTAPQKHYETPTSKYPSLVSRYTIAPKHRTSGMTELIRRSHANSSFAAPTARKSPLTRPVYSPLLKSSRRSLSQIAPLHPNRRTPPPPLPPLPPKKKSKKEQELEEKWEEEIIEDIGGINEWLALSEGEKNNLKRSKRDREMGFCED